MNINKQCTTKGALPEPPEDHRDYLAEAIDIARGKASDPRIFLRMPETAHIVALHAEILRLQSQEYISELLTNYLSAEATGLDWQEDVL